MHFEQGLRAPVELSAITGAEFTDSSGGTGENKVSVTEWKPLGRIAENLVGEKAHLVPVCFLSLHAIQEKRERGVEVSEEVFDRHPGPDEGRAREDLGELPGMACFFKLALEGAEREVKPEGHVCDFALLEAEDDLGFVVHGALSSRKIHFQNSTELICLKERAWRLEKEHGHLWNGIAEFLGVIEIVFSDADDFIHTGEASFFSGRNATRQRSTVDLLHAIPNSLYQRRDGRVAEGARLESVFT